MPIASRRASKLRFMLNPDGGPTSFNLSSKKAGGSVAYIEGPGGPNWPLDKYVRFRYHVSVGSGPGKGVIQCWIGDTLVLDEHGLNIYPVNSGSGAEMSPYFSNGFTFGYWNGGVAEDIAMKIDDFKVWDRDPGWGAA